MTIENAALLVVRVTNPLEHGLPNVALAVANMIPSADILGMKACRMTKSEDLLDTDLVPAE